MVGLDEVLDKDEVAGGAESGTKVVKIGHRGPYSMNHQFFPWAIGSDPEVRKGAE
jgi:hypothetical protein